MKTTEFSTARQHSPAPAVPELSVWLADSGPAGPRLPLAFESLLYLRPAHQALQTVAGPVLSFYLEDATAGCTVGQLHLALDPAQPEL
ncbi:MAG: hypothetical protein M3Y54_20900, partial [Bacteroidota bacterium]|nr:hypothetical protein [Bacteroidota bacterium]